MSWNARTYYQPFDVLPGNTKRWSEEHTVSPFFSSLVLPRYPQAAQNADRNLHSFSPDTILPAMPISVLCLLPRTFNTLCWLCCTTSTLPVPLSTRTRGFAPNTGTKPSACARSGHASPLPTSHNAEFDVNHTAPHAFSRHHLLPPVATTAVQRMQATSYDRAVTGVRCHNFRYHHVVYATSGGEWCISVRVAQNLGTRRKICSCRKVRSKNAIMVAVHNNAKKR